PGRKQVFRFDGMRDVIALREEPVPDGGRALLTPVMAAGRPIADEGTLEAARIRFEADLAELPPAARAIVDPEPPHPAPSGALDRLTREATARLEEGGARADRASG
ncbi:MAG TPA: nicotinate phosphoribosyltransferase, partial [Actinomycetota bacterium]